MNIIELNLNEVSYISGASKKKRGGKYSNEPASAGESMGWFLGKHALKAITTAAFFILANRLRVKPVTHLADVYSAPGGTAWPEDASGTRVNVLDRLEGSAILSHGLVALGTATGIYNYFM